MTTEIQSPSFKKGFDLEALHPLYPRREITSEYKKVGMEYETTPHDRAYQHFYAQTRGRAIDAEVTQIYRKKVAKEGEYLLYNLHLTGTDWKGNEQEFSTLWGRFEKPIFKLEKNPETQAITATQIASHKTVHDIPFTREKLDELLEMATEPVSLIVFGIGGRKFSIFSIEDYRNGTIEDLVTAGDKGNSLETTLAEKKQFTYKTTVPKKEKPIE
jgi:hypothetical protein